MQEIQFLEFMGGSNSTHARSNYLICMRFNRISTVVYFIQCTLSRWPSYTIHTDKLEGEYMVTMCGGELYLLTLLILQQELAFISKILLSLSWH